MEDKHCIPNVILSTGNRNTGVFISIDGLEIKTVQEVRAELAHGAFAEVTVKFFAIINQGETTDKYE